MSFSKMNKSFQVHVKIHNMHANLRKNEVKQKNLERNNPYSFRNYFRMSGFQFISSKKEDELDIINNIIFKFIDEQEACTRVSGKNNNHAYNIRLEHEPWCYEDKLSKIKEKIIESTNKNIILTGDIKYNNEKFIEKSFYQKLTI